MAKAKPYHRSYGSLTMMLRRTSILRATALLAGLLISGAKCSDEPKKKEVGLDEYSWESEPNVPPEFRARTHCIASLQDPFSCMAQTCSAVHGKYDAVSRTCNCPNSEHFFVPYFGGKCLPRSTPVIAYSSAQMGEAFKNISDPEDLSFDSLIEFSDAIIDTENIFSSGIALRFGNVSHAEAKILQNALLNMPPETYSNTQLPIHPGGAFQVQIVAGEGAVRKLLLENLYLAEIQLSQRSGSSSGAFRAFRNYWEPNPDRWAYLIQRRRHSQPSDFNLENSDDGLDLLRQAIQDAWRAALRSEQKKNQNVQSYTQDGCAGHCIITQNYSVSEDYRIQEIQEYVGGLLIRHQLIADELRLPLYQARYAILEIDPSHSPNVVYLIEVKPESLSGDLLQTIQIYSRAGELLLTSAGLPVLRQLSQELAARDAAHSHFDDSKGSSVVICDSGLLPSAMPSTEASLFRVGPHVDKSFWGWMDPEVSDFSLREQFSGLKYLSDVNQRYYVPVGPSHGASVAQLATQNTNLSAISISADQCFSHFNKWQKNVRGFARVINVSAFFHYDHLACILEPDFKNSIGDAQHSFLWVLGAGNDGRKNLTVETSLGCPDSLGPRSNMVVVTGKPKGQDAISDYASSGRFFADIVADDSGFYPAERGTSYAAPRVSRVAALLGQEFPKLNIEQLRASVLLGARVPYLASRKTFRFLSVRAGGILDETGARQVAQHISVNHLEEPMTLRLATQILTEMGCAKGLRLKECKLAEFKSTWFKETKVFGEEQ